MAGRGACRVPERWTDYIPLGHRMPGTRFIAFKVPLKKSFDQNLLPEERFSPHDLIRKVKERKEELGLIIDLTYTTRYYGREDLPPTLHYSKILTMGHEIPNSRTILRFKNLVKKFLTDNKDNDKLIGVHCTHGLNRTGYLVCRYLIDVEGMEPNAAIELFNESRGHPIERTNYIQDLQERALKNCELKNLGSDLLRRKGSAPDKKQLVKSPQPPLAVPRSAGGTKKKQRPGPTAQGQPQELGHGALGQLEWKELKNLEQGQLEKLEQGQQKHLEQRQLEQRQLEKLEQRQQKKLEHLEQRQQKLEQKQQNQLQQRQKKKNHLEPRQQKLEQRQQKKLEHLEPRQEKLEQRQKKKNHLEPRQQKLEQRQQNYLGQNHLEQRQLNYLGQNYLDQKQEKHLEQNPLEQRQPCSLTHRNCWFSPPPDKHKELFPPQSHQEPSPARKRRRRRRKHKLGQQEMS